MVDARGVDKFHEPRGDVAFIAIEGVPRPHPTRSFGQHRGRWHQTSRNLALEGLREALRQRKATAAEIARYAIEGGVWKILQPYLEAMTANA